MAETPETAPLDEAEQPDEATGPSTLLVPEAAEKFDAAVQILSTTQDQASRIAPHAFACSLTVVQILAQRGLAEEIAKLRQVIASKKE